MGGVRQYFLSIKPFIEAKGHKVYFFDGKAVITSQPGILGGLQFVTKGLFSDSFAKYFREVQPDSVHIQSEFGVGVAARNFCLKEGIPFSTGYHTHMDILAKNYHFPNFWVWPYLRWLFRPATVVYVHTERLKSFLREKGITNPIAVFPPGVDPEKFHYQPGGRLLKDYPAPRFVTMGRVSKEKTIEGFLDLDLPGTKFVIGNGPYKSYLMRKYKDQAVVFLPYDNVAGYLSECDVFVSSSKYDTFNLTILEALSCGLPVAAYPVMGPLDIIQQGISGFMSEDLKEAALSCLSLKKASSIERSKEFSWEKTAEAFIKNQILINLH